MSIEFNHTIVHARDPRAAAAFVAELFGLPEPQPFGHFTVLKLANGVSLDFLEGGDDVTMQHYAFLVSETEFDEIRGRIKARGMTFWADPFMRQENTINTHFGGRGLYFKDLAGHLLEIITRPYGAEMPR